MSENPLEYDNFIAQQLQEAKTNEADKTNSASTQEEDKTRHFRPVCGYCIRVFTTAGDGIKIREANSGKWLYINFTSHDALEPPKDKNNKPVLDNRHIANDLEIPLLIGTVREHGESLAIDVVFHPVIIARCKQHNAFSQQVIDLALHWIQQETIVRFKLPHQSVPHVDYYGGRGENEDAPLLFPVTHEMMTGGAGPPGAGRSGVKGGGKGVKEDALRNPSALLKQMNTEQQQQQGKGEAALLSTKVITKYNGCISHLNCM